MENGKVNDKVERYKALAELLLKQDKRVYFKDVNEEYYFGDILFVGEDSITVQCFAPEGKRNKKYSIYWVSIIKLAEYKEDIFN